MSNIIIPDGRGGQSDIDRYLQVEDSAYYNLYGRTMVVAATVALENQRRWTHAKMGVVEVEDPYVGKDLQRVSEPAQVGEATFGLRGRMFSKLQSALGHMAQLKPKETCPLPEEEMVLLAHALGFDFRIGRLMRDGRGWYVHASLGPGKKTHTAGSKGEAVEELRRRDRSLLDEDIRAMIGYRAILQAAEADLRGGNS